MVALGVSSVFLNFDSDRQRQVVRKANGKGIVWGKPAEVIRAKYLTAAGEVKDSILLVCGWWGVVRHFNYVPELCAAFLWSVPCLFNSGLPYFYFTFLLILLSDRARRDDQRCRSKYGKYWDEYCKCVPCSTPVLIEHSLAELPLSFAEWHQRSVGERPYLDTVAGTLWLSSPGMGPFRPFSLHGRRVPYRMIPFVY